MHLRSVCWEFCASEHPEPLRLERSAAACRSLSKSTQTNQISQKHKCKSFSGLKCLIRPAECVTLYVCVLVSDYRLCVGSSTQNSCVCAAVNPAALLKEPRCTETRRCSHQISGFQPVFPQWAAKVLQGGRKQLFNNKVSSISKFS